jgi:hypothetical protein
MRATVQGHTLSCDIEKGDIKENVVHDFPRLLAIYDHD